MGTDVREPLKELSACGLPAALEVMGERWSFMILRASFNGVHHFEEFLSELGASADWSNTAFWTGCRTNRIAAGWNMR